MYYIIAKPGIKRNMFFNPTYTSIVVYKPKEIL